MEYLITLRDKLNDLVEKSIGTRIDPPAYDFDDTSKTTTTPGGDTVARC